MTANRTTTSQEFDPVRWWILPGLVRSIALVLVAVCVFIDLRFHVRVGLLFGLAFAVIAAGAHLLHRATERGTRVMAQLYECTKPYVHGQWQMGRPRLFENERGMKVTVSPAPPVAPGDRERLLSAFASGFGMTLSYERVRAMPNRWWQTRGRTEWVFELIR